MEDNLWTLMRNTDKNRNSKLLYEPTFTQLLAVTEMVVSNIIWLWLKWLG